MSDNPFTRAARGGKRVDYHRLNDGSDEEADIADRVEEPQPKRPYVIDSSKTTIPIE
jgi:hypothetical protein